MINGVVYWEIFSGSLHHKVPGRYSVYVQYSEQGEFQCVSVYDYVNRRKYMIGATKAVEDNIPGFASSKTDAIVLLLDEHGIENPSIPEAYASATSITHEQFGRAILLWSHAKSTCRTDFEGGINGQNILGMVERGDTAFLEVVVS